MTDPEPQDIIHEEDGFRIILRMVGMSVEMVSQYQDDDGNWIVCPDDDEEPPTPEKRF